MSRSVTGRALGYVGDGSFELLDAGAVPPGPGEVQIAVSFVGICGTDLQAIRGHMDHRLHLPAILGHEMVGRVDATGAGVEAFAPGDPVTVMPWRSCGTCEACREGLAHICPKLTFLGLDAPGALQQWWTVQQTEVVSIPETLSAERGVLIEPTAVACHAVGRVQLGQGTQAIVIGAGPVGMLVAIVARNRGAEVLIVEVDSFRREAAERAGFATLDATSEHAEYRAQTWIRGVGVPVCFEVSGSAGGLGLATELLSPRGTLVVVGIHAKPADMDLFGIFWRELAVIGARLYTREDVQAAIDLVEDERIVPPSLVSEVYPLSRGAEAFRRLARGGGVMKVVIDCADA